ncbi:hypothetical protein O0I10_011650 [Lichtheimia ornata]|uniref:Uncharacterized protein n=1 Tax=Lichtheimia ornata TaxID=688661 RepID=A0AAD7UT33_9FUNG|nr:uncharacterized protein O0I10_011650 [Lichtheimia ornata]KAJ8652705.1 hypothetical protein O0I10_011650 [Lichtheimia ornata]
MTMEDNISWSQLLKHSIVTAEHSNGKNRIAATTETLQQTVQLLVEVLNERAKLLANSAQFEAALRDSAAIRALLPGSGLGYMCMGDVYCQQGHHAAAISIYDQGLQAVPESDPCYQQLQQQRMKAVANNDKRIDFISQLPLDVVITNIVPRMEPAYLESDVLYEPLYVSRSWQESLLQQPKGLWFTFDQDQGVDTFKTGHAQLIRFAPYVQYLEGNLFDVDLDDLFSRAHFSNLKELDLLCRPTTPRLPLIHGLQMIADSLTRLSLFNCPLFQLHEILETCPNLEFLETEHVDAFISLSSSSIYPKMKHLALCSQPERAPTRENMVDILRRFPSLQVLEVMPTPDSSLLPILHKHCPYLQVLYYGTTNFASDPIDVHPNRKGVTLAHLGVYEEDVFMQDHLIAFLYLHSGSLEKMAFEGIIDAENSYWRMENGHVLLQQADYEHDVPPPSRYGCDPTLSQASFNQLTSITFSGPEQALCHEYILWLISNAPNLQSIALNKSYIQHDVASAMINARHLCKLEVFQSWGGDDDEGVKRLLNHHVATMGDGSTLEEVIIHMLHFNMSAAPWITLLCKLKSLKNLKLLVGRSFSKHGIPIMEEIGQGCPALKDLTLGHRLCTLADGLFKPLCKHPNIECLRIEAESLSNDNLMDLCAFNNLQQLQLTLHVIVADDKLEMLRNHIPKVIVIDDI